MTKNISRNADTQAEFILRARSPRTSVIYAIQASTAKEIWIMWKCLEKGSSGLLKQWEGRLFDEYERFRAVWKTKHGYLTTPRMFSCYTHLKAYGAFMPKDSQETGAVSSNLLLKLRMTLCGHYDSDCYLLVVSKAVSTNQQPAQYCLQLKAYATVHDGHIVTEPIQRKAPGNVGNTGARGKKLSRWKLKRKEMCWIAEAGDRGDEASSLMPHVPVAFMANLSSTSATNNPVNEVHTNDNQIFDNVDYQLSQEMHQEEHLDSDAETEIDDNTIPYHQYLLDTEAQNVPTEVSADTSDKVSMIAIFN
ncbi:hypothetical protein Tco_0762978 [Tanacetum coccineum]